MLHWTRIARCAINLLFLGGALLVCFRGVCFGWEDIDLGLRASVSQGYDDNITFVKDNPRDDFFNSLSLGVSAEYPGKRRRMRLSLGLTQQLFYRFDSFNNNSQNISFSLGQEFSRHQRMVLSDTFSHSYEPRSFLDAFGRTAGRYAYYRNRFSLGYSRDMSRSLSWDISYGQDVDIASRRNIGDSYLHRLGFDLNYLFGSRLSAGLAYDFSRRSFDPGEAALTNTLSLTTQYYLGSRFSLQARAGGDFVHSYNNREYLRPLVDISLSRDIDENTGFSLGFGKRYYTNAYTQDLFSYRQVNGQIWRQMRERLSCRLSGFYGEGRYVSLDIRDTLRGAGLSLAYDIGQDSRLDLNYTYTNSGSTQQGRRYKKNSLILGWRVSF